MSSTLGVSSPGGGSSEEVRRSVRIKTKKPKPKRGHSSWPIDVHALCGKTKRKAGKRRSTTAAGKRTFRKTSVQVSIDIQEKNNG